MTRFTTLLLLCLFLGSISVSATPHYPNGIPSIGPLQGGATAWGKTRDGEYFDETSYGADYEVSLPTGEKLSLDISASDINYSGKTGHKRIHSFSIQNNITSFTGEFNLCILNPNEEIIKKNYKGSLNVPDKGTYFTNYKSFDFREAKENVKIALELIVTNGETIYIVLDDQTAKDLLFIAKSFPDNS